MRSDRRRSIARLRAVVMSQEAGLVGHPVARPSLQRDGHRVLERVLGEVDVAEGAGQDRDRAPVAVAEGARDGVMGHLAQANSRIGRTSMAPKGALGMRRAASIAWSRVSHSTS